MFSVARWRSHSTLSCHMGRVIFKKVNFEFVFKSECSCMTLSAKRHLNHSSQPSLFNQRIPNAASHGGLTVHGYCRSATEEPRWTIRQGRAAARYYAPVRANTGAKNTVVLIESDIYYNTLARTEKVVF